MFKVLSVDEIDPEQIKGADGQVTTSINRYLISFDGRSDRVARETDPVVERWLAGERDFEAL